VFQTCNSSNTQQQWVIWKTESDQNNIRICQQGVNFRAAVPSFITHLCLTALTQIDHNVYRLSARDYITPIKPNNEARDLMLRSYNKGDPSQELQMNSTTHQLASVPHPKVCMTTRHLFDASHVLLVECNGYGYESPNPHLTNKHHQRFNFTPALDKNGEQLCYDNYGLEKKKVKKYSTK